MRRTTPHLDEALVNRGGGAFGSGGELEAMLSLPEDPARRLSINAGAGGTGPAIGRHPAPDVSSISEKRDSDESSISPTAKAGCGRDGTIEGNTPLAILGRKRVHRLVRSRPSTPIAATHLLQLGLRLSLGL
jgi:hypothetical protein